MPALLALALLPVLVAAPEEPPRAARKPYAQYKIVEDRNIFAPRAVVSASGAVVAAETGRVPMLSGIVYDTRAHVYKGLLEVPGQPEPRYVLAGDPTPLGPVVRISIDQIVVQGDGREIAVGVGNALRLGPGGVPADAEPVADAAPEKIQEVLDRLRARHGKSLDSTAAEGEHKAEAADSGVGADLRPVFERMKERWKRKKSEESSGTDVKPPKEAKPPKEGKDKDKKSDKDVSAAP